MLLVASAASAQTPSFADNPPPAAISAAQARLPDMVSGHQGKLLLTSGVSSIDGAAGGGLTPWALTASHATDGSPGVSTYFTHVGLQDYTLDGYGIAVGWGDRLEVSVARQDFDTGNSLGALGFSELHLRQTIVGLKLRVAGDAILDSDRWMPQVAIGVEHKRLDGGSFAPVLRSLGASTTGTDFYVSATKLLLAQGVLLNGTLRSSRANQNGLLGFGSSAHHDRQLQAEMSVAKLLRRDLAVGIEYRSQSNNLDGVAFGNGLRADDWKDIFIAWAPVKWFSLTLAYVDLGHIAPALTPGRQTGAYVSAQLCY